MRHGSGSRRREDLTKLAARQHGAVSLAQLEAIGYSRNAVARRAREGSLVRIFPRVYRIGGCKVTPELRARAALLWAGRHAVASHDTAAALWGVAPPALDLHVTVPRRLTSPPRGIRTHAAALPRRDCGTLRGVPITSPARTLLDLAASGSAQRLLPLVEQSVVDGLVTADQLREAVKRNPGRRGCRRLGAALDAAESSPLERRVEAALRGAGLPPHEREFPVGRFRLDFAWPSAKVAIEADGRRWHSTAAGFDRDRAKHNLLVSRGWRVLRVTRNDLGDPEVVRNAVAQLLAGG